MALERRTRTIDENLGRTRVTLDDLRELERVLDYDDNYGVHVGQDYEATSVNDLSDLSSATIPRLWLGGTQGVSVHFYPSRTDIYCLRPSGDDLEAADHVRRILNTKRIKRKMWGLHTNGQVLALLTWMVFGIILLQVLLAAYREWSEPPWPFLWGGIIILWLFATLYVSHKITFMPAPDPVIIHPEKLGEQRFLRRRFPEIGLAIAFATLIVTIVGLWR